MIGNVNFDLHSRSEFGMYNKLPEPTDVTSGQHWIVELRENEEFIQISRYDW